MLIACDFEAKSSSNAVGTTTIRDSQRGLQVPPVTRMSTVTSIPGSFSSRRISLRGHSPSIAGSTRVSLLSFKTEPPKKETPPRKRVASLTPSKKTPQTLSRLPSASSALNHLLLVLRLQVLKLEQN